MQGYSDHIRSQDLTFTDHQKCLPKEDINVDDKNPDKELDSDWTIYSGVKMTNRDITFDTFSPLTKWLI